ncbi:EamA/RhaT family transporter [Candidatus Woesearchaeota archaeon]|nr:EamA/RhaT family transporter [Candidatus Woesearchaeota archaeon]
MATKPYAIFLILLTTLFTSLAQLSYKAGAATLSFNILEIITNPYLIIGLTLYGIGAVLMVIALKAGELSILYPIIATSYIWVSIFSVYLFGEIMNLYKWIGVIAIILGVVFIGLGSKKDGLEYTEAV